MPAYGVTQAGFAVKPLSAILSGMQASVLGVFGQDYDLSPSTPDGQMLGILANEYSALWEIFGACWNQFNRADAEGASLDVLGDLVGIPRESQSYTQVYANVTLDPAHAPYAAGALVANIAGLAAQTFTNEGTISAAMISGGVALGILFQSTVIGPTPTVNPGTLTAITTPVTGWTAITNPNVQSQLGASAELDAAYAVRQEVELAAEGTCNPSATAAAIQKLGAAQTPPVTLTVAVLENTTPTQQTVSGIILPPHTYAVFVYDQGTGWVSGTPLAGTVSISNGSTAIAFSTAQTLAAGTQLIFTSQPNSVYTLSAAITAATAGVLTVAYSGTTNSASAVSIQGAGVPLIGQTIYANKPAGITPIGTTQVTVQDPVLGAQTVFLSAPNPKALYISATVVPRPGSGISFAQLTASIQNALVLAAVAQTPATGLPPPGQLAPGSAIVGAQLEAVIMGVPGVFDVQALTFDFVPSPTNTAPIVLPASVIATLLQGTIATYVIITPGVYP